MRRNFTYGILRGILCGIAIVSLGLLFKYVDDTLGPSIQTIGFWDALQIALHTTYPLSLLAFLIISILIIPVTIAYQNKIEEKEKAEHP